MKQMREREGESLALMVFLVGSLFTNTIYIYQNVVCYIKLEHLMSTGVVLIYNKSRTHSKYGGPSNFERFDVRTT
jgi:hypothetical protein